MKKQKNPVVAASAEKNAKRRARRRLEIRPVAQAKVDKVNRNPTTEDKIDMSGW